MMKMKMSIYFIVNSAQVLWDMSSQCTGPGWFKSCGIGLRHLAGMRHYTFSSWQFRSWWRVLCINVCVRVYRVVDFNNMKLSKAWHCSGSISSQAHSFWRGSSSWFFQWDACLIACRDCMWPPLLSPEQFLSRFCLFNPHIFVSFNLCIGMVGCWSADDRKCCWYISHTLKVICIKNQWAEKFI